MAYPAKLLANGEQVEFELRPHWRALLIPIIWLLVIVGVGAYVVSAMAGWLGDDSGLVAIVRAAVIVVGIFLLVFLFIRPFVAWFSTQYVFTNRRVIVRTGLIARRGRDMPLSKVNNVSFEHTVLERVFNCGTLEVESASEHGMLVIANVPNVEHVQREVYRLHDEDDAFRAARSEHYEAQFRAGQVPEPLADQVAESPDASANPGGGNTGGAASGGTNRGGAASGGTNPGGAAATPPGASGPQA